MLVSSENSESPSVGSIERSQQQQQQYQERQSILDIKPDHDAVLSHLKQEDEHSPQEDSQDSQQRTQQQEQQNHLQQVQQHHVNGNTSCNGTAVPTVEITEYSPEWAYPEVRIPSKLFNDGIGSDLLNLRECFLQSDMNWNFKP